MSFIEKDSAIINKHIFDKNIKSKIIKINYNKFSFFKKKIKNDYLLDKNNLNNIHFVYKISKIFGISNFEIFKSLNLFKGLKFRKQIIYNKSNLKIINDSKSTSFSSTKGLLSLTKIYIGLLVACLKGRYIYFRKKNIIKILKHI